MNIRSTADEAERTADQAGVENNRLTGLGISPHAAAQLAEQGELIRPWPAGGIVFGRRSRANSARVTEMVDRGELQAVRLGNRRDRYVTKASLVALLTGDQARSGPSPAETTDVAAAGTADGTSSSPIRP